QIPYRASASPLPSTTLFRSRLVGDIELVLVRSVGESIWVDAARHPGDFLHALFVERDDLIRTSGSRVHAVQLRYDEYAVNLADRSEERRVGKECRTRSVQYD